MYTHNELLTQISNKIQNYRLGELGYPLDERHVECWISQFGEDVQEIILQETNFLLSQCYFSESKIRQFLYDIFDSKELWNGDNMLDELEQTQFLDIQNKGSSQSNLLAQLNDIVEDCYPSELPTESTDHTNRYVYIDDCLFSGNTLRRDLERWIHSAKDHSTLDIIFVAIHSAGEYYLRNTILPKLCDPKGIKYRIWYKKRFKNNSRDLYNYDCLWPKETSDKNIALFIEDLNEQAEENTWPVRLFRDKDYSSLLYTSGRSREIFEKEMLRAGAYIYSCCANPNSSMKPMGYDYFNSLGFGAFFATYKNISNNCPLAFWWGDPSADEFNPLCNWYPLLPRKVN